MTKIYVVLKNVDFTEGRGPCLYHKTFTTLDKARNYVKNQSGVMGGDQYDQHVHFGKIGEPQKIRPYNATKDWVPPINTREYWNGYDIVEGELE